MKNIKLIIEYDGTGYCGWQIQPNGISVQQIIEEALLKLTGEKIRIHASGRTDAGVHALGQTVNFHTQSNIPPESFYKAVNAGLPVDISIVSSCEVTSDFHSRFSAEGKHYRYLILNRNTRSPFYENKTYRYGGDINLPAMKKAAAFFEGTHDFKGFMASKSEVIDTVRTIQMMGVEKVKDIIAIDIRGKGFLYNMVRIIAGTLLECGTGKIRTDDIPGIIESCERSNGGVTLPAAGLYLMEVFYI